MCAASIYGVPVVKLLELTERGKIERKREKKSKLAPTRDRQALAQRNPLRFTKHMRYKLAPKQALP
jgi:hypothetical protein